MISQQLSRSNLERTWDAIVIGAGPAGALAARQLALAGAKVLLVERKRFPRFKVCGDCLSLSALRVLESVGLGELATKRTLPITSLRAGMNRRSTEFPLPKGAAIPRQLLDLALARAAVKAGAVFVDETQAKLGPLTASSREVELLTQDRQEIVNTRVVIVAAGLVGKTLLDRDEFATHVATRSRVGVACLVTEYPPTYREGAIFMAIGRGGYVGLTRTIEGLNVAGAFDQGILKGMGNPAAASSRILEEAGFPEIPALAVPHWSGTLPMTRQTQPVASDRVFLIGDAAGYVEPFTGQGIAFALEGAKRVIPFALAGITNWNNAVARGWIREYRTRIRTRQWPSRLIATIVGMPSVARFVFEVANVVPAAPRAFARFINRPLLVTPSS